MADVLYGCADQAGEDTATSRAIRCGEAGLMIAGGVEETAGAYLAPDSLSRAWARGINPSASLNKNEGYGYFQALGDPVITGPTLTTLP